MGNNASQSENVTEREEQEQWTHSYPRSPRPQRLIQNKVLPDVTGDVHQNLRPTNNGEILYSGGTISGRHCRHPNSQPLPEDHPNGINRSNSSCQNQNPPKQKQFISNAYQRNQINRSSLKRNRIRPPDIQHSHLNYYHHKEMQMKSFGSVPDLRGRNVIENNTEIREMNRGRKKYKAPPPPTENVTSNVSSLGSWVMDITREAVDMRLRKARLYKTKSEMKNNSRNNYRENDDVKNHRSKPKESAKKVEKESNNLNRLSLVKEKSRSLPEFQAELREATKKLRSTKLKQNYEEKYPNNSEYDRNNVHLYNNYEEKENKLKTLDHNTMEHLKFKMMDYEKGQKRETHENIDNKSANVIKNNEDFFFDYKSNAEQQRDKSDSREQPSKTFYFGMDDSKQLTSCNNKGDYFALNVQKYNCITQAYSGSDMSSEVDIEDTMLSSKEIALHLRPILPKKQLEIPRFSPAVAWKLLSIFDSNPPPSIISDECPVLIEDRIEKLSRVPPSLSIPGAEPRSSHDKSGDSGISGDAGPPVFEDNSEPLLMISKNNNAEILDVNDFNISWTPQQDLEDEESNSESGINNNRYVKNRSNINYFPRSQVFSLSLPRDNQLAAYMEEKAKQHNPQNFSNLQRLKRSVSGVLNNLGTKKDSQATISQDQNNNWFLSRSTLNSLNSGFNSLELHVSKYNNNKMQNESTGERVSMGSIPVNNSSNSNNGRVIYLPEYKEPRRFDSFENELNKIPHTKHPMINSNSGKNIPNKYVNLNNYNDNNNNNKINEFYNRSKSCENISFDRENTSLFEPENLQDPPVIEVDKWKGHKSKKFTFQSTVRQIERKKLAEKLSREAERKEQQRLSELEAMQKVEEEFQRKRAKEKASIRQQLRLFSLDDAAWSSLPLNWDSKNMPIRLEPDGTASSNSSPILENSNALNNGYNFNEHNNEYKMIKTSENKPGFKEILSRQESQSSTDTKVKAQATQVLSEYRQSRREYKDYRITSRCFGERSDSPFQEKNTTVHPQITFHMPKAHGQGPSMLNNYRRNFAHGIILPVKSIDSYSEESRNNNKHSPRIAQNHARQGKCIS